MYAAKDAQKSTFVNPNAHRYGLGALLFQGFLLSSNLDHVKFRCGLMFKDIESPKGTQEREFSIRNS